MSDSKKIAVSTPSAPAAIGPYTQAVRIGDFLYTSGQVGFDPATGALVDGGIQAQTERVLANIGQVLAAAGLDFTHVVKTTVYLLDLADFVAMNEVYGKAFAPAGVVAPARTTIQAAKLPREALVEIDCVAAF